MAPGSPRASSNPGSDWIAGLVLGVISGIGLLSLGTYGLAMLAVTILLVLWKGPRLLGSAAVLTGLGLIWTVLFARVGLGCGPATPSSPVDCDPGDIWLWTAVAAAIFAGGLVASAWALRRMRR